MPKNSMPVKLMNANAIRSIARPSVTTPSVAHANVVKPSPIAMPRIVWKLIRLLVDGVLDSPICFLINPSCNPRATMYINR